MIEKLIENWLINANELGYQIPFCEALLTKGYSIIHISSHGPGEHGKDIVARDSKGKLWSFQLKGGDIRLSKWREIRGEVEELVRLPVSFPGISTSEPHVPVLVTNGEILGDARESIKEFADKWGSDSGTLRVWSRGQLRALFIEAHGKFLPTDLHDVRRFVELYVTDFRERIPRGKFCSFLVSLVANSTSKRRKALHSKRAIESMALMGGYIAQQYAKAGNYVSEAEAWTIIASTIFHVAASENLAYEYFRESLNITETAIGQCLTSFEDEVLKRPDFMERAHPLGDPFVYGARVLLSLGWLAANRLSRFTAKSVTDDREVVRSTFLREFKFLEFLGEADWPSVLAITLFVERLGSWIEADRLLEIWASRVISAQANKELRGLPYPYWPQEKVLGRRIGALSPSEEEEFAGRSYTLMSALDMLVRRLCRQKVAHLWSGASRINECTFTPDVQAGWFVWISEEGVTTEEEQPLTASWKEWRESTANLDRASVPNLLIENPQWILPFLLTFPHRCTRSMSALADCLIGRRGRIREQAALGKSLGGE
ncbi:MAG: hypothetical protein QOH06_1264 [Acidobacteriota bacterium]|nr:hypothetical protein [Acidobacteriota bacterium]